MKLSFLAAITLFGAAIASPVAAGKEEKPVRLYPQSSWKKIANNATQPLELDAPCKQDGSMGNCKSNYCEVCISHPILSR